MSRRSTSPPWLARSLFAVGCLGASAVWLPWLEPRHRPVFALVVLLFGLLFEQALARTRPERVAGSLAGLFVGCGAGAALLVLIPTVGPARSLGPFLVVLLGFLGAVSGGRLADRVVDGRGGNVTGAGRPRILDTSAIIDGRIAEIAETGLFDEAWIVPGFVLRELHAVADADNPGVRSRGRRGLAALERLKRASPSGGLSIAEFGSRDGDAPVDERLVLAAESRGGVLVTTDHNLERIAGLRGVPVLNIHAVARALRPPVAPGDRLPLRIVREGSEPGQGVGHLEDGTMVVVEDGRHRIGGTEDVEIARVLHTASGKLFFARLVPRPDDGDRDQNG